MTRHIDLRRPRQNTTICLAALFADDAALPAGTHAWNEQEQRAGFATQWKREEVRIISVDGNDVGWLQVAELPTEIRLQKFFRSPHISDPASDRKCWQLARNLEVDGEEDRAQSPQEQSCPAAL